MECRVTESHPDDATTVLVLAGDWVEGAGADLYRCLDQLAAANHCRVVVDLLGIQWSDESVLAALVRGHLLLQRRGGWLRLVFDTRRQPIGFPPLSAVFEVYASLEAALTPHSPPQ